MEKYVIKRNGDYKPFEAYKIQDAIQKAFQSVNKPFDKKIYKIVLSGLEVKFSWPVEEIQDIIESLL